MDAVVLHEVRAHPESFAAHLALVGLLPRMDSLVLSEVHPLIIALPTFAALKWFFSSVDSPVLNKVGGLKEKFPTVVTSVPSLTICALLTVNVCARGEIPLP